MAKTQINVNYGTKQVHTLSMDLSKKINHNLLSAKTTIRNKLRKYGVLLKRNGLTKDKNKYKHLERVEITFDPNKNAVPDVWRYVIEIDKNGQIQVYEHDKKNCLLKDAFIEKSNYDDVQSNVTCKDCPEKTIVLLLESPHKDEYDHTSFKPIAPVQANKKPRDAGKNIDDNIEDVISKILSCQIFKRHLVPFSDKAKYGLIVANPIPFQTSLAILKNKDTGIDKELRDKVWYKLWQLKNIRTDFKKRLKTYNPVLIINACTQGDSDFKQDLVTKFLKSFVSQEKTNLLVETSHPSSPQFCKENLYSKDRSAKSC